MVPTRKLAGPSRTPAAVLPRGVPLLALVTREVRVEAVPATCPEVRPDRLPRAGAALEAATSHGPFIEEEDARVAAAADGGKGPLAVAEGRAHLWVLRPPSPECPAMESTVALPAVRVQGA